MDFIVAMIMLLLFMAILIVRMRVVQGWLLRRSVVVSIIRVRCIVECRTRSDGRFGGVLCSMLLVKVLSMARHCGMS